MAEKITVYEPDDIIYTMDGYGRVRMFAVLDSGFIEEGVVDDHE